MRDRVMKVFRALPPKWKDYTRSMRNTKDLDKLIVDELAGRLRTYEMEMVQDQARSKRHNKEISLKSTNASSSNDDDEMEYLAKKFNKLTRWKKRNQYRKGGSSKSKDSYKEEDSKGIDLSAINIKSQVT